MGLWLTLDRNAIKDRGDTLYRGQYIIVVNPLMIEGHTANQIVATLNQHAPLSKQWSGKTYILEKAWMEKEHIAVQVSIIENPIPIMVILGGLAILLGGVLVWQIVVEIRKLLTLTNEWTRILLIVALVWLAWWLWKRKKH